MILSVGIALELAEFLENILWVLTSARMNLGNVTSTVIILESKNALSARTLHS
jgi:hypothetical protein